MRVSKSVKYYIFIIFLTIVCSCARMQITRFYLLEYNPKIDKQILPKKPYPYNIEVKEFTINRTYDNSRIVIRHSAHEVYYDRLSLWARRPQIAITDLLIQHINKYNIVKNCKKRFLQTRPDFYITGKIHSIDRYYNRFFNRADIHITVNLIKASDNQTVLNREILKYSPLYTNNMSFFAKVISDNLNTEFSKFVEDMIGYFESLNKE